MKKVLLVIDGITPDRAVFDYAVQLCSVLKARLNILQIVRAAHYEKYVKKLGKQVKRAKRHIEGSLVAATFAEAGEPEMAKEMMDKAYEDIKTLLPESEKADIQCQFLTKPGNSEAKIREYMNEHRDVVFTIYDAASQENNTLKGEKKNRKRCGEIRNNLPTPLVTIQARP
jgi:hypothetical protein